jgi:hypothetical protein
MKRYYNCYLNVNVRLPFLNPRYCFETETVLDIYYSADDIKENDNFTLDDLHHSPDYLALTNHNGVPPHALRLKKDAICTIMRNLSVPKGLVKNARVVIQQTHRYSIEVQVINNRTGQLGETHSIPRIRFNFKPAHVGWTVHRRQFPLRLAYACTFNGCSGLTLDRTVLDLRSQVFAHGQLYTALSRVRESSHSRLLIDDSTNIHEIRNVVYQNLIL